MMVCVTGASTALPRGCGFVPFLTAPNELFWCCLRCFVLFYAGFVLIMIDLTVKAMENGAISIQKSSSFIAESSFPNQESSFYINNSAGGRDCCLK